MEQFLYLYNYIFSQTNTFQAMVLTDGSQSYTIFTYNCTDLEWEKTNSLVIADCSFIGYYAGRNFFDPQFNDLQIDYRTANITQASCGGDGTSWNNFIFPLSIDGELMNKCIVYGLHRKVPL